jgi:hypothetical protein
MTVNKMLTTGDMTRYLFPEVFRDAIVRGMEYTPFFKQLIVGEETVDSTGLTMPSMDWRAAPLGLTPRERYQLRDVNEGATIPEAEVVVYSEKQVTIHKKARGLKQTYESLMFVPINLASVYFEELGVVMGADMDRDLINIAINGDQADNSQSAPVIGVATAKPCSTPTSLGRGSGSSGSTATPRPCSLRKRTRSRSSTWISSLGSTRCRRRTSLA